MATEGIEVREGEVVARHPERGVKSKRANPSPWTAEEALGDVSRAGESGLPLRYFQGERS
jgi:hypothetical protein